MLLSTRGQNLFRAGTAAKANLVKPSVAVTLSRGQPALNTRRRMSSRPSLLGSPQETVDAAIKNHTVVVFSKEWCGFCRRAKDALDATIGRENYSLLEMESFGRENLVSPLDPQDFQDYFKTLCGTRSVPKVFFAGKFIGGGDETVALAQSGQLAAMAQAAGLGNAAKAGGGDSGSGGGNDGAKAAGVGGGATSKPPPAKSTNERFFVNGKMVDKPISGL